MSRTPAGDSSLCVASQLISFGTDTANWLACRAVSGHASKVSDEGPGSCSQCASIAANFIGCIVITTRALSWPLQITAPRAIAAIGNACDSEIRAMSRCCRRSRYQLETAAMNIAPVSIPALRVCVTLASAVG